MFIGNKAIANSKYGSENIDIMEVHILERAARGKRAKLFDQEKQHVDDVYFWIQEEGTISKVAYQEREVTNIHEDKNSRTEKRQLG